MPRARASSRGPLRATIAVLAAFGLVARARAGAAQAEPIGGGVSIRATASVDPGVAKLGESLIYRGRVVSDSREASFRFLPPEPDADFVWGRMSARLARGQAPARVAASQPPSAPVPDTFLVEVPLQVFRTGDVIVPGLRFETRAPASPAVHRLPAVTLVITSVLSAADSNADLRPVRGPIGAPWWERIPWRLVIAGLLLIAALVWVVVRMRKRKRVPAPAPVVVPAPDAATLALTELATLRRLQLPANGRFAEHAFHLSRILRRFLEATAHTPLPGDTTGELIAHLEASAIAHEDLEQLAGLLRIWDRVKFGRAPSSKDEATRAEQAVENLVRRALPAAASERAA